MTQISKSQRNKGSSEWGGGLECHVNKNNKIHYNVLETEKERVLIQDATNSSCPTSCSCWQEQGSD